MAGCYRLKKSRADWFRKPSKGRFKVRTRSYHERDFPWAKAVARWKQGRSDDIPVDVKNFVTLSYAVATGHWWDWRKFATVRKNVSIAMRTTESKREDEVACPNWTPEFNPSKGLVPTCAFDPCRAWEGDVMDSAPYSRRANESMDDVEFEKWVTDEVAHLTRRGEEDRTRLRAILGTDYESDSEQAPIEVPSV